MITPDHLADLNGIGELTGISETSKTLRIGAMTRQRELERSATIAKFGPMLPLAIAHIGHQQTRNRGTIGGSICRLDPGAELPVVAAALDASSIAVNRLGKRALSMSDFAVDCLTDQLDPDELLLAIEIPKCTSRIGIAFGGVFTAASRSRSRVSRGGDRVCIEWCDRKSRYCHRGTRVESCLSLNPAALELSRGE